MLGCLFSKKSMDIVKHHLLAENLGEARGRMWREGQLWSVSSRHTSAHFSIVCYDIRSAAEIGASLQASARAPCPSLRDPAYAACRAAVGASGGPCGAGEPRPGAIGSAPLGYLLRRGPESRRLPLCRRLVCLCARAHQRLVHGARLLHGEWQSPAQTAFFDFSAPRSLQIEALIRWASILG